MARMAGTAARAEALLGHGVVSTTPVAGGDICTATRLRLSDGRSAVIKTRPQPPEGFFEREAEGLRWLADAGGANVPELLAVSDDCIVLTWVEPGKPSGDVAERFGRALAATHAAGAEQFGADVDGYIGLAPLPNRTMPTWPEFYASRRVMPYVRAAVDRDALSHEQAMTIENVMKRIHDFAGDPRAAGPRARRPVVGQRHLGHRRRGLDHRPGRARRPPRDRPRDDGAVRPSAPAARASTPTTRRHRWPTGGSDRVGLHQLHPLLVHAVLFGGTYGERAASTAQSLLDGPSDE